MQSFSHCGWIEVIVGPMNSGKSGELLRRLRCASQAGRRTLHLKALAPEANGGASEVIEIQSANEVRQHWVEGVEIVGIEDVHFLGAELAAVAAELTSYGVRVILAGLDTDFRGETFGVVGDLMAQAEVVQKLQAICVQCGSPGTRTQRLVGGRPVDTEAPTFAVDEETAYETRCRACHMVPLRAGKSRSSVGTLSFAR